MTSRSSRVPATVTGLLLAVLLTLAGCSQDDPTPRVRGIVDCAATLEHDGHTYWGTGGLRRTPEVTGRSVDAVLPGCNHTGSQQEPPGERVEAQELARIDIGTALLVDDTVYVRTGRELPGWTRAWMRAPRCTTQRDFRLTADWLGVTGPHKPRFDGDLRLPYRLEVRVTDGPAPYVGATIHVFATPTTHPALGTEDVKRSLWQGGQVVASVHCSGGRFEALALHT